MGTNSELYVKGVHPAERMLIYILLHAVVALKPNVDACTAHAILHGNRGAKAPFSPLNLSIYILLHAVVGS